MSPGRSNVLRHQPAAILLDFLERLVKTTLCVKTVFEWYDPTFLIHLRRLFKLHGADTRFSTKSLA